MAEETPAKPVKVTAGFRGDCTAPHPLWSGWPARLVRDRRWREDIPMASADGDIPPSFVDGVAPPDARYHVR